MLQREYDYYYERSMKFQERVSRHILGKNIPLQAEVFRSVEPVPFHLRNEGEYRPIAEGETWGGAWESGWFRLRADIPSDWSKRQLALHLNLGGEALLFDRDGTPIFARSRFSQGNLSATQLSRRPPGRILGRGGGERRPWAPAGQRSGIRRKLPLWQLYGYCWPDADRLLQSGGLAALARPGNSA